MASKFPATLDMDDVSLVEKEIFGGGGVPVNQLAPAAWGIIGYGAGLIIGQPKVAGPALSNAQLQQHFQSMKLGDGTILKNLPWQLIIQILLSLFGGKLGIPPVPTPVGPPVPVTP